MDKGAAIHHSMNSNLPDDVTPGDIDRHYEPPNDELLVYGVAKVAVSCKTYKEAPEETKKQLLRDAFEYGDIDDLLDVEIVEEEII